MLGSIALLNQMGSLLGEIMYYIMNTKSLMRGGGKVTFDTRKKLASSKYYALAKASAYRLVNKSSKMVAIIKYDGASTGEITVGSTAVMSTLQYSNGAKFYKDPAKAKANTGVYLTSIGSTGKSGFIDRTGELR